MERAEYVERIGRYIAILHRAAQKDVYKRQMSTWYSDQLSYNPVILSPLLLYMNSYKIQAFLPKDFPICYNK